MEKDTELLGLSSGNNEKYNLAKSKGTAVRLSDSSMELLMVYSHSGEGPQGHSKC